MRSKILQESAKITELQIQMGNYWTQVPNTKKNPKRPETAITTTAQDFPAITTTAATSVVGHTNTTTVNS